MIPPPPLASYHWAPEAHECGREGKLVGLSLPRGWGIKLPLTPPANDVLYLNICYYIPRHQTYSKLRALHTPRQSLLVGGTNPRQFLLVLQLQKSSRDVTGPVGHAHCLLGVFTKTYPVKEVCEDAEPYIYHTHHIIM